LEECGGEGWWFEFYLLVRDIGLRALRMHLRVGVGKGRDGEYCQVSACASDRIARTFLQGS